MRRPALLALAAAVIFCSAFGIWKIAHRGNATPVKVDAPAGATERRRACSDLNRFEQMVEANDRQDRVVDVLRRADREAARAADHDPRWRSLAGGAAALKLAIQRDDPEAARIGIKVVRAECAPQP